MLVIQLSLKKAVQLSQTCGLDGPLRHRGNTVVDWVIVRLYVSLNIFATCRNTETSNKIIPARFHPRFKNGVGNVDAPARQEAQKLL